MSRNDHPRVSTGHPAYLRILLMMLLIPTCSAMQREDRFGRWARGLARSAHLIANGDYKIGRGSPEEQWLARFRQRHFHVQQQIKRCQEQRQIQEQERRNLRTVKGAAFFLTLWIVAVVPVETWRDGLSGIVTGMKWILSQIGPILRSTVIGAFLVMLVPAIVAILVLSPFLIKLGKALHDDIDSMTPPSRPYSRTNLMIRKIARFFDAEMR